MNRAMLISTSLLAVACLVLASCKSQASPVASSSSTTDVNSSNVSVYLSSTSQSVKTGDVFTIDVMLNTGVASRGAQCTVTYNPKMFRCDDVTEGSFFKDWASSHSASTIVFPQPAASAIDNNLGTVSSVGIAIMGGDAGGANGTGVIFTLHFTSLVGATVAATLSSVVISDQSGVTLESTIVPGISKES